MTETNVMVAPVIFCKIGSCRRKFPVGVRHLSSIVVATVDVIGHPSEIFTGDVKFEILSLPQSIIGTSINLFIKSGMTISAATTRQSRSNSFNSVTKRNYERF